MPLKHISGAGRYTSDYRYSESGRKSCHNLPNTFIFFTQNQGSKQICEFRIFTLSSIPIPNKVSTNLQIEFLRSKSIRSEPLPKTDFSEPRIMDLRSPKYSYNVQVSCIDVCWVFFPLVLIPSGLLTFKSGSRRKAQGQDGPRQTALSREQEAGGCCDHSYTEPF